MTADEERVEELRRSLKEATKKVQGWTQAKTLGATATVDSKRLASYYEPPLPARHDGKAT
jgi:hypothetical protein